ncbi:OstA-like protein [Spirosoma utsteinense]|uniref:Lipopolysaccharide export system protein LptA n=1 Tax=Spirosoma utsteinense TaxID=2585773 RepID=A0ABR6VZJ0_9BACT|nr:OstA-like protein [Spirosoma utsteinense]MBC3784493.1 lipopolysaccharide export system protein LptA [Spirosoma utsteinense]MBC3789757.1 lipopolysaccharide export system protein LptA [Spirosoma utsteinense]
MVRFLLYIVTCFILLGSLLLSADVLAQTGRPPMAGSTAADKVELLPGSDSLVGVNSPGQVIRKIYNNVRFRQKGVLMYCDLAIQNVTTNVIEAYGNVRLVQGDTINVRGDTMFYYGNTRLANLRGHVVMRDRKMTLTTAQLDYDMVSGVAHYPPGAPNRPGRIVDKENVLTSQEGYYDTHTKLFTFRQNVRLVNPKGTLTADSLLYNSLSRLATFQGPTRITNKDGVLTSTEGQYNTATGISNFQRRATVDTPKYRITGDSLYYDNVSELGIAKGNVIMVAKDRKAIITGEHVRYNGKAGISRVTGRPVAKSLASETTRDTLYLRADTLFSFDNKRTNTRRLIGQKNVFVYKSDLQSKCDSLIYDSADSTIYFFKKPIVWSQNKYQMEADTMRALLKDNRINTMFLKAKSFVISLDTLRNYNQIKGRTITAYFVSKLIPASTTLTTTGKATRPTNKVTASAKTGAPALSLPQVTTATSPAREETSLNRVIVEGNGQSIYYAVDDKNKMIGLNHVECSRMNLEFTNNKVGQIRFYGRPDAQLIPPKEFTEDSQKLDGFRWREAEKPTKGQVLWLEIPPAEQPAAKKPLKIRSSAKPLAKKNVQRGNN